MLQKSRDHEIVVVSLGAPNHRGHRQPLSLLVLKPPQWQETSFLTVWSVGRIFEVFEVVSQFVVRILIEHALYYFGREGTQF